MRILFTEHSEHLHPVWVEVFGPSRVAGTRKLAQRKTQNLSVSVAFPLMSGCRHHKPVIDATSILHPVHPQPGCNARIPESVCALPYLTDFNLSANLIPNIVPYIVHIVRL